MNHGHHTSINTKHHRSTLIEGSLARSRHYTCSFCSHFFLPCRSLLGPCTVCTGRPAPFSRGTRASLGARYPLTGEMPYSSQKAQAQQGGYCFSKRALIVLNMVLASTSQQEWCCSTLDWQWQLVPQLSFAYNTVDLFLKNPDIWTACFYR